MAKTKWPKLPSYLIPLFNSAHIYLCRSKEEWVQAHLVIGVEHSGLEFSNGLCRHFNNEKTGENIYLIGVFDNSLATLVHECAHATFYCCSDVGVTTNPADSNETYCYLLDRMFRHFLPYIKQD